jgi:uncharacterized tellurite resistance protein B-like protein
MLAAIRQLIQKIAPEAEETRFGADDYRLSVAALLFHAMAVDGFVAEHERDVLAGLLRRRFALSDDDTEALIGAAEAADSEAVDLYGFTSVLKRKLDDSERARIIEMMWEMAFADGEVHEFEDNLIWRVAELLAVPSATRISLKQAVRARTASAAATIPN